MEEKDFQQSDFEKHMRGTIQSFRNDLSSLRSGRATAKILDPVEVDVYGARFPLSQVATISVPEARQLSVQVWDKAMLPAVEKAINISSLGLSSAIEGQVIRLRIPESNQERRQEMVKVAHKYAEAGRVAIRHIRRDALNLLKKLEKNRKMAEDLSNKNAEKIQRLTDDFIAEINRVLEEKEKEILNV